jgi:hypothetical protein
MHDIYISFSFGPADSEKPSLRLHQVTAAKLGHKQALNVRCPTLLAVVSGFQESGGA